MIVPPTWMVLEMSMMSWVESTRRALPLGWKRWPNSRLPRDNGMGPFSCVDPKACRTRSGKPWKPAGWVEWSGTCTQRSSDFCPSSAGLTGWMAPFQLRQKGTSPDRKYRSRLRCWMRIHCVAATWSGYSFLGVSIGPIILLLRSQRPTDL